MDPVACLNSILCGHEVHEHIQALREWLARGGFEPECLLSVDCDPLFAHHCSRQYGNNDPRDFKATSWGVWSRDYWNDDWQLVADWSQLLAELEREGHEAWHDDADE